MRGHLHFNASNLTSRKLFAGKNFLVSWDSEAGCLSVHHRNQQDRTLWATPRHGGFVYAALGESTTYESRGSYSLYDNVEMHFTHQTIEDIGTYTEFQSRNVFEGPNFSRNSKLTKCCNDAAIGIDRCGIDLVNLRSPRAHNDHSEVEVDPDGTTLNRDEGDAIVVLTGCLYTNCKLAKDELRLHDRRRSCEERSQFRERNNNDEEMDAAWFAVGPDGDDLRAGVRYKLVFSEKRDNQLGFHVELDSPFRKKAETFFSFKSWRFVESSSELRLCLEKQSSTFRRLVPELGCQGRIFSYRLGDVDRCHRGGSFRGLTSENGSGFHGDDEMQCMPKLNRVLLTYASEAGEKFYGFGEQFSCFDMKGKRVPIMVQEQGIGRGDQPITMAANLVSYRAGGDWHTTYAPSPHYLTSDMNSLFLEGYEHCVFDLTRPDCVQLQVHAGSMKGRILYGQNPPELIKEYTAAVGRMRELPAWITKGVIVGMQGGHKAVRDVWRKVKEYDVPLSAFWLQDWVGQRKTSVGWQLWWNWEVDRDHYQGWEELVRDFKACGVKTMTYCNPFIVPTDKKTNRQNDLFTIAQKAGYLVSDTIGATYMIPNTSFEAAMLDITNPETRRWFKHLMYEMVKTGVCGWMADFGESLPFDCCLHSGEDPATAHNKYPEMWAELNREFVEEWEQERLVEKQKRKLQSPVDSSRKAEDFKDSDEDDDDDTLVFFMRAGYRGSPRSATLFWEGDQMVSWGANDGIKSAVTGLLSSGVSGYAFNHSDIGGYCTVDLPFIRYSRTEELLLRWMELNAFSVIFRTHEGNVPKANTQFYSNDTTLRHFTRSAKIYKAWEFYRRQLVKEAAAVGMPVVRHLFLHYPEDKYVQTIVYKQFLVGSEILVVPVLDKGHTQVQAYFPSGDVWEHVWTGHQYRAPATQGLKVWVQAPLGYPAVFVKKDSWVRQQFIHNLEKENILEKTW